MQQNLTEGPITKKLILFALPLMAGNILQQLYNIVDTLIVGRMLGELCGDTCEGTEMDTGSS